MLSASWNRSLLSSFRRITVSKPHSFKVLINGAFRYSASATITSAKWPCLFFKCRMSLFAPVSSPSSFSEPSLGFSISCPKITCGDFPTVIHTTLRWKYFVFPVPFFRLRQSVQDFFVLLNNSIPSIPAATYPPMVPSRNTRLRFRTSIVCAWISSISFGSIRERRSLTASTFGIFPRIQFFSCFSMLSGAEKMVWKLSYWSIRKISTGITILNNGMDFLFLSSDKPLIFCGILYTLFM